MRPNMADVDTPFERLIEAVHRQTVALPAGVKRDWFNNAVATIACQALQDAMEEGSLAQLFDAVEPTKADLEMTARLLAELIDDDNPRLQAKCMDFVFGLRLCGGKSQTEIAQQEGVGKAAVSNRCVALREAFRLPPSRGMKSDRARESYAERQRGKRARPRPVEWAWKGLLSEIFAT